MSISESEFIGNKVDPASDLGYGGAILIDKESGRNGYDGTFVPYEDVNILIDLSNFSDNLGYAGGAITFQSCAGVVQRCRFIRNQVAQVGNGADIGQFFLPGAVIAETDIGIPTEILSSYFEIDGSTNQGGSIHLDSMGQYVDTEDHNENGKATISFQDSNNKKLVGGSAKIDGCTFVGLSSQNSVRGGAIYVRNDKVFELTSSRFYNTNATSGGVVYA